MSTIVAASVQPRWKSVSLWVVRGLFALAFVSAGGAKLYGVPMLVEEFEQMGLGQWFRYFTGTLEVLGAVLVLVPSLAAFAAFATSLRAAAPITLPEFERANVCVRRTS